MPPFMAYQSLVMGDAFGRAFQFGKRKISAMSNEEFNKLDIVSMFKTISHEYVRLIPTVQESMSASTDLQVKIVEEMLRVLPAMGAALLKAMSGGEEGQQALWHLLHGHPGMHVEEGGLPPVESPENPVTLPTPPSGEEVHLEEDVPVHAGTQLTSAQKSVIIAQIKQFYKDISLQQWWLNQINAGNSTGGMDNGAVQEKIASLTKGLKEKLDVARDGGMSGTQVNILVYAYGQYHDGGYIII